MTEVDLSAAMKAVDQKTANKPDTAIEMATLALASATDIATRVVRLMTSVSGVAFDGAAPVKQDAPPAGVLPKLAFQAFEAGNLLAAAEAALNRLEEDLL